MIFVVHDFMRRDVKATMKEVQERPLDWISVDYGPRSDMFDCLIVNKLEELMEFIGRHDLCVMIKPPQEGFPYPILMTDTKAGHFHQR